MRVAKWEMIKHECSQQFKMFRKWDNCQKYELFHRSHYDWWAFPVDRPSSYRDKYQIGRVQRQQLIKDEEFIQALRGNAVLVCRSWGWDLTTGTIIKNKTEDQRWQKWPVRLYKMTCSLQIFQQYDLHRNAVKYGMTLINKGQRFSYNRKSFEQYFRKCQKNSHQRIKEVKQEKTEKLQEKEKKESKKQEQPQTNIPPRSMSVGKPLPDSHSPPKIEPSKQ